jgi:hypothetical protein
LRAFLISALAIACAAYPSHARQSILLDSLLQQNRHTFVLADEHISGDGAAILLEATRGAAYVALGENHNTRAIPLLTVALFRALQARNGFQHVALEEGPALGRMLSAALRTPASGGALAVARRYPNAFHMFTEDELGMIDRIGALSNASEPVWGLNQEFALSHVFARLSDLGQTEASRSAAHALLERSLMYESERHARDTAFIVDIMTAGDFHHLRSTFSAGKGTEADFLLEQAELSHAIYAPYRQDSEAGFEAFFRSSMLREENMKELFARHLSSSSAHTGTVPGVLVKAGHTHLGRGRGPNGVLTLGNFLSEVATSRGSKSVHLYVVLNWPDLADSWLQAVVPHLRDGENWIFDLRPLTPWAVRGELGDLESLFTYMLTGYDFLVVLGDSTPGSIASLCTPNFRWYVGTPECH